MDADGAPQAYSTVRITRGDKTVRISLDDLEVRNSLQTNRSYLRLFLITLVHGYCTAV